MVWGDGVGGSHIVYRFMATHPNLALAILADLPYWEVPGGGGGT